MEIWKDVVGLEQLYKISNLGNIYSLRKNRLLMPKTNKFGYKIIILFDANGKGKDYKMHRLVLTAFLGESKLPANHINRDKSDNRLENLEYVTHRENQIHRYTTDKKTSKFIGCYYNKNCKKWRAKIKINGKEKHLGYFENEMDAHLAYVEELKNINETSKYIKDER